MPQTIEDQVQHKLRFVEELKVLPVAVQTAAANEQHYEVRQQQCVRARACACVRASECKCVVYPQTTHTSTQIHTHTHIHHTHTHKVPTEYFTVVLGPHRKYSSCLYNSPRDTLDKAEANMLGRSLLKNASARTRGPEQALAVKFARCA